jgi:CheY-like chemotaxis protein
MILIAVPDLIFRAKISEPAKQGGRKSVAAATPDAVLERAIANEPALVIVDLGDERIAPLETIRRLKAEPALANTRVLGFFSHVFIEQRDAAREAGCDQVMPRSAFVAKLAGLLESLGA